MHTQKRRRLRKEYQVIGYDSETLQGPPITHQFFSATATQINGCIFIGSRNPTAAFLSSLKKLKPGQYRMYGHNLEFDMLSALWDVRANIRDGNIDLKIGDWIISGRYTKPIFANINDGERYIELVDSLLWFMTSLDKAGELVCPHIRKLERPAGIGETLYTSKDDTFVAYAMRDAEIAYHLGMAVEKFHNELDIPSQISLASMAAAVFRLKYMQANMYQPPLLQWLVGAAASYHGGVNRVRPNAAPAWHMNITALDLSSAYPTAMSGFPAFSDPAGYRMYRTRDIGSKLKSVPPLGVYKITGTASSCDWPAMFDHNFKPLTGRFFDNWVSGYELNESLRTGEVVVSSITGYVYDSNKDTNYSPFRGFVSDFYGLKNDAQDAVMRYMYKILLNALSGKLIQTSPDYTLVDGRLVKIKRAGGLYHPFSASLTTGHTRANIHQLEHQYSAIHTATDGIFVPGNIEGNTKKNLGATVCEGKGDLALFRNKLYIFYTDTKNKDSYESKVYSGRYILKCARHGFQGAIVDLERMASEGTRVYKTNKPIKLKTAIKRNDTPNKFVVAEREVHGIGELKVFNH